MKTLDCNGVTISVPGSWADVTLEKYEGIYRLPQTTVDERITLIANLCDTTAEFIKEQPVDVFNAIYESIAFIFSNDALPVSSTFEIDGVRWIVNVEDVLTLGEWIDAEQAQKGDKPLTGTLAVVCRPVGEKYTPALTEEREKFFAQLSVENVKPLLGFFLRCKHAYELRTGAYGNLAQIAEALPSNTKIFQMLGVGIKSFRIWQIIRFTYLIVLLKWQLRKSLPLSRTKKTAPRWKKYSAITMRATLKTK